MKYDLKILKENFDNNIQNIINEGKFWDFSKLTAAAKSAKQFLSDYIKANPEKAKLLTFQTMLSLGALIARYILAGKDPQVLTQGANEFIAAHGNPGPYSATDLADHIESIPDEEIVVNVNTKQDANISDIEPPPGDNPPNTQDNNLDVKKDSFVNKELDSGIGTGEQLIKDLGSKGVVGYFHRVFEINIPLTKLTLSDLQDMFKGDPVASRAFTKIGQSSLIVQSTTKNVELNYDFTPNNESDSVLVGQVDLLDKNEFIKHITVSSSDGTPLYEYDIKTSGADVSKEITIENVIFHKENLGITNDEAMNLAKVLNDKARGIELSVDTGRGSGIGTGKFADDDNTDKSLEEENINKSSESNNGIEAISNAIMNDSKKQLDNSELVIYNKDPKTSLVAHIAYHALKANGKLNKFLPNTK